VTTLREFTDGLAGREIAGVRTRLDAPPQVLHPASLPAQWVQNQAVTHSPKTFKTAGGWPVLSAQFVIAHSAVGEPAKSDNWAAVVDLCDAVNAVFAGAVGAFCRAAYEWTARPAVVTVGEKGYFAVVVDVTANG
jgi:hypothetical protein